MDRALTPRTYEVRIESDSPDALASWFADLEVTEENGVTVLRGELPDQSALHGLLARVRDLAVPLVEVRAIPPRPSKAHNRPIQEET